MISNVACVQCSARLPELHSVDEDLFLVGKTISANNFRCYSADMEKVNLICL